MGLFLLPVALGLVVSPSIFSNGLAGEELRKLQGEWVLVSGGGFRFDDSSGPEGNAYTFLGDRLFIAGTYPRSFRIRLNPNTQPKQIELLGPVKESGWPTGEAGIYEVDGDTLSLGTLDISAFSVRPTSWVGLLSDVLKRPTKVPRFGLAPLRWQDADPYDRVHVGMAREEVSSLLGPTPYTFEISFGPPGIGVVHTREWRTHFWDTVIVGYKHGWVVEKEKVARPLAYVWYEILNKVGWKVATLPVLADPPAAPVLAAPLLPAWTGP
jgi:uncharacterized protein (TIGR03067 family)